MSRLLSLSRDLADTCAGPKPIDELVCICRIHTCIGTFEVNRVGNAGSIRPLQAPSDWRQRQETVDGIEA
jgi:hypothetical protein